jgi:hypothetical protein
MNPSHLPATPAVDFPEDDLLRLEMKVAQRADQLSERHGRVPGRDLEHWLQAEREIFEGADEHPAAIRSV